MPRLLIATTNPSKFREYASHLEGEGIDIKSLADFPGIEPPEEIHTTFLENALLKARYYFGETRIPCVTDDGGLMIDYLDGAPGVSSRRWLGRAAADQELAEAVLEKMKGVVPEKRGARLGGVMVFHDGVHTLHREHWTEGIIAEEILDEIRDGFPYRSLFLIPQFEKPYSRLSEEEHEEVNFRRKSIVAMRPEIFSLLGVRRDTM
jgi:XTP/dITP diphosphohydrolase